MIIGDGWNSEDMIALGSCMEQVEEFLCAPVMLCGQDDVIAETDESNCEKLKALDFVVLVCMSYQCPVEVPISAH